MEKIYRRDNGSRVKVVVHPWMDFNKMVYRVDVYTAAPRKRTYLNVEDSNDFRWRRLSMEDRRKDTFNKQMEVISKDEYNQCLNLAWEEFKPKFL